MILVGILLATYSYFAARAGARLVGQGLLIVFTIGILASFLASAAAGLVHGDSIHRSLVFFSVIVIIEDALRTTFVVEKNHGNIPASKSALAFAVSISFTEMILQIYNLIIAASAMVLNADGEGVNHGYGLFFSSPIALVATIAQYGVAIIVHYLLCILLFNFWKARKYLLLGSTITAHIFVNIIIDAINTDVTSAAVPILGVKIGFAAGLYLLKQFSSTRVGHRARTGVGEA